MASTGENTDNIETVDDTTEETAKGSPIIARALIHTPLNTSRHNVNTEKEKTPVRTQDYDHAHSEIDDLETMSNHSDYDTIDGIVNCFTHIVKPLARLNDPKTRSDKALIERNKQHLQCLTKETINQAMLNEKAGMKKQIDLLTNLVTNQQSMTCTRT